MTEQAPTQAEIDYAAALERYQESSKQVQEWTHRRWVAQQDMASAHERMCRREPRS